MKKSLLLLFLMAAAFMGGVIPVFAEATIVTNKATLNRIARIGSTGNYLTSAFLQSWESCICGTVISGRRRRCITT